MLFFVDSSINFSMNLSRLSSIKLDRIGLMMLPCGTPSSLAWYFMLLLSNSTYPALTSFQYRLSSFFSLKCCPSSLDSSWWSMLSKNLDISPSINHETPVQLRMFFSAEWQPLWGLNPCDLSQNLGSRTASRVSFSACWTILSLGLLIPRGLVLPFGLGILTLRTGLGL